MDIIKSYFAFFLVPHNEVTNVTFVDDFDWSNVLGLKQSSKNQMEFSKDSHREKMRLIIKSYNKFMLK